MNDTGIFEFLWFILVCANFTLQLLYFFNTRSRGLFAARKVSTPLLLFGALAVVVVRTGGFTVVPGAVLLAMGLGELGIEGSQVVEGGNRDDVQHSGKGPGWTVIAAGTLFLLVNLFIGITLLRQAGSPRIVLIGIAAGFAAVFAMVLPVLRIFRPPADVRFQVTVYSAGLAVLAGGALSDLFGGPGSLGRAALVLTISDSLVMIRMGANWNGKSRTGRILLFVFLVTILILYYLFIALLMGTSGEF
jgi:hypothetical protein